MADIHGAFGRLYLSEPKPNTQSNTDSDRHGDRHGDSDTNRNGHRHPYRYSRCDTDGYAVVQVLSPAGSLLSGGNTGMCRSMSAGIELHSTRRFGLIR